MQKLKKTRRKPKEKHKETYNKNIKTQRKTEKHINTGYPAHEPPRKKYISKGLAGRFLFFMFLCFFCVPSSFSVFLFLYMCFSIVNAKA